MPKGLQITARILLYLLRVMLWAGLAVGVVLFAFYYAKDVSNIYIISTDGMQRRAGYILKRDTEIALEDFFTPEFIAKDALLNEGKYDDYFIRDFDYKFSVQNLFVLPWSDTAKVQANEQVPMIDGEMLQEKMPQGATEKIPPPAWQGALYELTLTREKGGQWLVSAVKTLKDLPAPTPLPLLTLPPGMEFPTPKPSASATPAPSISATSGPVPTRSPAPNNGAVVVQ